MISKLLDKSALFKKLAQDPMAALKQVIDATLQEFTRGAAKIDPRSQLKPLAETKTIDARILIPEHGRTFDPKNLTDVLTQAVQKVMPGFRVAPIYTYTTGPTQQTKQQ